MLDFIVENICSCCIWCRKDSAVDHLDRKLYITHQVGLVQLSGLWDCKKIAQALSVSRSTSEAAQSLERLQLEKKEEMHTIKGVSGGWWEREKLTMTLSCAAEKWTALLRLRVRSPWRRRCNRSHSIEESILEAFARGMLSDKVSSTRIGSSSAPAE